MFSQVDLLYTRDISGVWTQGGKSSQGGAMVKSFNLFYGFQRGDDIPYTEENGITVVEFLLDLYLLLFSFFTISFGFTFNFRQPYQDFCFKFMNIFMLTFVVV